MSVDQKTVRRIAHLARIKVSEEDVPRLEGEGAAARFDFAGESDALIVGGLIAVLHALYAGLAPAEVLAVDAPRELGRLGLDQHLSAQRSNGLRSMVTRIRAIAERALEQA